MRHSKQEILEAVRRHAEEALSWEGEQLTITDVYLFYESDLSKAECTVGVRWNRSDIDVKTDDALYTVQDDKTEALDIFGPEWWEYPPPWRLHEVI
jgi:hypothetical protein